MNLRVRRQEVFDRLALVRREVVRADVDSFAMRLIETMSVRNAMNSADVCRSAIFPGTSPVLVLKAA